MEFVKTKTTDGLIFQGLLSEPETRTDTVIVHLHGIAGNFWEHEFIKTMLKDYPKKGVSFLTIETRGSEMLKWFQKIDGSYEILGSSYEMFEDCLTDLQAWVDFLKQKGYEKIHLQGHSLGCPKIVYYLNQKNEDLIKSLILISPLDTVGLCVNENSLKEYEKHLRISKQFVEEGKDNDLLPDVVLGLSRRSAKSFINLYRDNKNLTMFNYYKPELGFEAVNKINIPLISFLGTKDAGIVTDAYKSTELLKINLKNCPKFEGVVFENALHSFAGFSKKIVEKVSNFILSS